MILRARCKPCQQVDYCEYVARNTERVRENRRASKYRQRFKMSLEQVDALFANAGNACEACGTPRASTVNGQLVIDHDHSCCPGERTCGECIRGVMCTRCNIAFGALEDSVNLVQKLLAYAEMKNGR